MAASLRPRPPSSNAYYHQPPAATAAIPTSNSTGTIPNPASAATLAAATTGGTLAASTTYYVIYTWTDSTAKPLPAPKLPSPPARQPRPTALPSPLPPLPPGPSNEGLCRHRHRPGTLQRHDVSPVHSTTSNNVYTITSLTGLPGTNTSGLESRRRSHLIAAPPVASSPRHQVSTSNTPGQQAPAKPLGSTELNVDDQFGKHISLGLATGAAPPARRQSTSTSGPPAAWKS